MLLNLQYLKKLEMYLNLQEIFRVNMHFLNKCKFYYHCFSTSIRFFEFNFQVLIQTLRHLKKNRRILFKYHRICNNRKSVLAYK